MEPLVHGNFILLLALLQNLALIVQELGIVPYLLFQLWNFVLNNLVVL